MRALAWVVATGSLALGAAVLLTALAAPLAIGTGTGAALAVIFDAGLSGRLSLAALVGACGAFSALGLVVLHRHPRHAIGWVLTAIGADFALVLATGTYTAYALFGPWGRLPGADLAAWAGQWSWIPAWTLLTIFLLVFPRGTLLSPRWRWAVWAAVAIALMQLAAYGLGPDPATAGMPVERSIVIPELEPALYALGRFADLIGAVVFVVAGVSLVLRFRRGDAIERQQVKWIAYSATLLGLGVLGVVGVAAVADPSTAYAAATLPLAVVLMSVPISAAIAVLKYRLYDIDVLINRTLVYGSLSAVVAVTYVGFVVLLQAALRPFTGGSELAVAGSTLATLALVQPLRRRIQDAVDRRFYRSRYDAARTLDAFAASLRDDVDLDHLRRDLLAVVGDTLRPAHAGVWLREGRT